MKSKLGMLWIVSALLLGMMSAGPVLADTGTTVWTGVGADIVGDFEFVVTGETSFAAGASFGLTMADGTGYYTLLSSSSLPSTAFKVKVVTGSDPSTYQALTSSNSIIFNLGTSPSFGFAFKDASDNLSFVYDVVLTYTDLSTGIARYLLTDSVSDVTVSLDTKAIPVTTPVPIPGSALLLGSSLLGLVGISTRKKKA